MDSTTKTIINRLILDEEGGFVYTDRKNDPDLGTFAGVRYLTFADYATKHLHMTITPEEFKQLAEEQPQWFMNAIFDCYNVFFWEPFAFLEIDIQIRYIIFSCAVNSGVGSAAKILQQTYNEVGGVENYFLTVDGAIGPITRHQLLALFEDHSKLWLITVFKNRFLDEWLRYYINIVQANVPLFAAGKTAVNQAANLEGWFNRVTKFRYED